MQKLLYILLLCALLASCSGNFTVEGNLEGMANQRVRMEYMNEDALKSARAESMDGQFNFRGSSDELTLVRIYDSRNELMAEALAQDGDHVLLSGNMASPDQIKVTCNDLTDRWHQFRKKHYDLYTSQQSDKLDPLIEQYVREHPDDALSCVLLMIDYRGLDNRAHTDSLLDLLSGKAKLPLLLQSYDALRLSAPHAVNERLPRFPALELTSASGAFAPVPAARACNVLYFWVPLNQQHRDVVKQLKTWQNRNVSIVSINIDADSLAWRNTIRRDSVDWQQFWAPAGPMTEALKDVGITTAPYYIVMDSARVVKYRGADLQKAEAVVKSITGS